MVVMSGNLCRNAMRFESNKESPNTQNVKHKTNKRLILTGQNKTVEPLFPSNGLTAM